MEQTSSQAGSLRHDRRGGNIGNEDMTEGQKVSRMDVLRYELAVELSKIDEPPLDPYEENDFEALLEALPEYHDGPRNSPAHLYAALADGDLVWRRMEVAVSDLLMGPGEPGLHTEAATQAEGFVARFARLVQERHSQKQCFRSYFWDAEIRYPTVPCVLVRYCDATPWLRESKRDYGTVYRLQDGYHRVFQMVLRGLETVPAFAACHTDGSPWEGNYRHLERFEGGRWIPREQ